MSVLDILTKYHQALVDGLKVTLYLCAYIWGGGLALGILIGALGARFRLAVGLPLRVVAFLLSGIPALVLLFWLHYPAQKILNMVVDPFITGALALSIINIFSVADMVRSTLVDFPAQYVLAGKACGLSARDILLRVELPIVFRQLIPPLLGLQVIMLQATLFTSLISVNELFRVAQEINAAENEPVEVYTTLAVFFLAICLPLNGLAIWLRHRFTRDTSEN